MSPLFGLGGVSQRGEASEVRHSTSDRPLVHPYLCVSDRRGLTFDTIWIDMAAHFQPVPEPLTGGPGAAVALLSTVPHTQPDGSETRQHMYER